MVQFETDHRERARTISDAETQLQQALQRRDQTELQVLRLTTELAELYLRKQTLAELVARENETRQQYAAQRRLGRRAGDAPPPLAQTGGSTAQTGTGRR